MSRKDYKLISVQDAETSSEDDPNTNVALFDMAYPGAQPVRSLQFHGTIEGRADCTQSIFKRQL